MIFLLGLLYARVHGHTNAFLYSRKGAEAIPENEHEWLTWERIIAYGFAPVGFVYGAWLGWIGLVLLFFDLVASVLAFSFFHNGHYNLMRDRIHDWANGWKYSSPTDTSRYNFTYVQRRNQLYIAAGIMAVGYTVFFLLWHT